MDYLITHEDKVVPVEVKAGTSGSLKSLQVFVVEKKSPVAFREEAGSASDGEFCIGPGECG